MILRENESYRKTLLACLSIAHVGFRKAGIQDRRDSGQKGFRTEGIQDWRETEKEGYRKGGIRDWRDTGKERYRKVILVHIAHLGLGFNTLFVQ